MAVTNWTVTFWLKFFFCITIFCEKCHFEFDDVNKSLLKDNVAVYSHPDSLVLLFTVIQFSVAAYSYPDILVLLPTIT